MPIIQKICLNSIRANANGRNVIVLTADNYTEYVTIPKHIVEAYNSGKLKHAKYDRQEWDRLTSDTYLLKLSWKGNDLQQLESDEGNVYNYIKELYI